MLAGAGLKREEEASLLLSQSLLYWNSAQFSSSLDSLSQGTAAFLDSASRSSASSEVTDRANDWKRLGLGHKVLDLKKIFF